MFGWGRHCRFAAGLDDACCLLPRAVNEVWRDHVFQLAVTFHGGMVGMAYEWGSRNHPHKKDSHGLWQVVVMAARCCCVTCLGSVAVLYVRAIWFLLYRLFRFYAWVVCCLLLLCPLRSGDCCTRLCREMDSVLRLRTVGHCLAPTRRRIPR